MSNFSQDHARPRDWLSKLVDRAVEAALAQRWQAWCESAPADEALAALQRVRRAGKPGGTLSLKPLLALVMEGPDRTPRYPAWQFEPAVLRYMPMLRKALPNLNAWNIYFFFTTTSELLGTTPLAALRAGQHQQALQAAFAANADY
jgi:hypothetical protein